MVQTLYLETGALNEAYHLEQIITEAREVIHAAGAMATVERMYFKLSEILPALLKDQCHLGCHNSNAIHIQ